MQIDEAIETFEEMKRKGLIRYVGLSNFSKKDLEYCLSKTEIATYQGLYNLLEPNSEIYHHKKLEYRSKKKFCQYVKREEWHF